MRYILMAAMAAFMIAGCTTKQDTNKFTVKGTIINNKAKWALLEKVPASLQPTIEDSVLIDKNGAFTLQGPKGESVVYNIRLDAQRYPVASIINDNDLISVKIQMDPRSGEFAEKYEVTGSPASLQMKNYMETVNTDLQKIYVIANQRDSLQKAGASDSLVMSLTGNQQKLGEKIRDFTLKSLSESPDPSLVLYELGYYQTMSNSTGFGLQGLNTEKVMAVVNDAAKKFPKHSAITGVKTELEQQVAQDQATAAKSFVGREAPDFTLPDVNDKPVSLSSFRGKYVLVDFWASWCTPCRQENPNVVLAYNQFKSKGFTVLGVSLDRPGQKDKWLGAIEADKLTWTHVSDLKYWESPMVPLYGLEGIPFNVLVDPDGKVVAQGLRGADLINTLAGLLK